MTPLRLLATFVLLIATLALAPRTAAVTAAQGPRATRGAGPEYGPPRGALFIGGGSTLGFPIALINRFIELGGGVDGKFVIVPTSGGNFDASGSPIVYSESQVTNFWRNRGLKNVKMLHTHDPAVANTEAFVSVLRDATAVWFSGGRHHHFVDSYGGTLTYKEFHKVLERGGVIGGSSAGATIQGEFLVRGDSDTNQIMMTTERRHFKGFEFLRRSAIDQHIDIRNRWDDLIPVIKRYPDLLGIGISEDTAIIVKGDQFEVIGVSKVTVHDNTRHYQGGKPYLILGAGDIYNMKARKIVTDGSPAVNAPPAKSSSSPPAAPSGTAASINPDSGIRAVSAPSSITLPQVLERLLVIASTDERDWQIDAIDDDADGEIDRLRIRLIDDDTTIWEIGRKGV